MLPCKITLAFNLQIHAQYQQNETYAGVNNIKDE